MVYSTYLPNYVFGYDKTIFFIDMIRYVMAEKVQPGKYIVQFQMKRQPNSTYVALDNIKMTLHELAKTDDEIDPTPTTTTTTTTTTGNILISRKKPREYFDFTIFF